MVNPEVSAMNDDDVLDSAGVGGSIDDIKATDGRGMDAIGRLTGRGNERMFDVCVGRSYCDKGKRR